MRIMHSLLVVSAAALFAGCAASFEPNEDLEESAQSQEELATAARPYVGTWNYQRGVAGTTKLYDQIRLAADRTYEAYWAPDCPPGRMCPMVIRSEKGSWTATAKTLTLRPSGEPRKRFAAKVTGLDLEISSDAGRATFRRLARENESCGGRTIKPTSCEPGLVCFGPQLAVDGPGKCSKPVAPGGACGIRKPAKPCTDGFECRWNGGPRDSLVCAPERGGDFCGGIANIACPERFECIFDGPFPDAGGRCAPCPIPACAAPPPGCFYEREMVPRNQCPSGCGKLVCSA
jgi:hypothetical protein